MGWVDNHLEGYQLDLCLGFPLGSRWGGGVVLVVTLPGVLNNQSSAVLTQFDPLLPGKLCELNCPHSWLLRILSPGDHASLTNTGSDTK